MRAFYRSTLSTIALVALGSSSPAEATASVARYTTTATTTSDNMTKLTWQQAPSTTKYTWANAKAYCAYSNLGASGGFSSWRLPTVKELRTLVDNSWSPGSLIDPTAFPLTPADMFWSLTPIVGSASAAWVVDFGSGLIYPAGVDVTHYVRCVRTGQ